jgi:signal transduction histidine kinase
MIELISFNVDNQESIVILRNKLLSLFKELNYNTMEAVRIVTKISILLNYISQEEKSFLITSSLNKHCGLIYLVIMIHLSKLSELPTRYLLFDTVIEEKVKTHTHIKITFPIKTVKLSFEKKDIESLKEKITMRTKAELMREILVKNKELNSLVENLKKSASLIQTEKMRALGVLTAGVAHELNNPMMGILNFIQYSLKKTPPEDKRYEALTEAEIETKRCIDIVRNLLTFSHLEKEGDEEFMPVDLGLIIKRVLNILAYRIRNEKIIVMQNIAENIPHITGHENRLQQVVLNLVTNAMDAMKEMSEKRLGIKLSTEHNEAKLTISDTGEGMDEITVKHIFEPFFTTKQTGSGTGLGLSVSQSIINEHHGKITYQTKKNNGTSFVINLPLDHEEQLNES